MGTHNWPLQLYLRDLDSQVIPHLGSDHDVAYEY
jgi:hypothetical protein